MTSELCCMEIPSAFRLLSAASPLPAYELQTCPAPPPFPNGYLVSSDLSVGQSLTFRCYPGYVLVGSPVLTCRHGSDRSWNHPFPTCDGKWALWGANMLRGGSCT